jgi:hypothetical protein
MKQGRLITMTWLLLSMSALTGCLFQKVHRPTSAAGALCAEQCDQQRYSCNNTAEASVQGSQGSCQARQDHVEKRCSPWVKDSDKQRCQIVNNPGAGTCLDPSPDYSACTGTWRSCIVSCGGYFQ